jgi:fermentation-respiration switch protein FrsA (DUF1100 family)
VLGVIALVALLYAGLLVWFRWNEDRFVYFPEPGPLASPPASLGLHPRRVEFTAPDGVRLVAWRFDPLAGDSTTRWALVLHGNAGNLSTPGRPEHTRQFLGLGLGVFAVDYRGYGESDGRPSEAGLYTDARAAYDFLRDSIGVPPARIVIYGHSLGSAVAVELATTAPAAGLIIEGAFTSAPDLGGEIYPFLPTRLLARNRFDSIHRIGALRMPLLVIHGRDDGTIPIAHGRRLFAAAPEPKRFLEVAGGHDDAYRVGAAAYEAGIAAFLASLPPAAVASSGATQ